MSERKINFHDKGIVGVLIVCVLLVIIITFFAIRSGSRAADQIELAGKRGQAIITAATQISSLAKRAEGHLMLYLCFNREVDRAKVHNRQEKLADELSKLIKVAKKAEIVKIGDEIRSISEWVKPVVDEILSVHDASIAQTGRYEILNHEKEIRKAHWGFSDLRRLGVELSERQLEIEGERRVQISSSARKMDIFLNLFAMTILFIIFSISLLIIRSNKRLNLEIMSREMTEDALKSSQSDLKILSDQTEQFSLAAAEIISMKNQETVFQNISNTIIAYSDYKRVIISLFKEEYPYRDIVGYGGIEKEKVDALREVEFSKTWYDGVFERGEKVGKFSYYIPHTIKHVLNQEAICYGTGSAPEDDKGWHPQDNLFVRMNDDKGRLIGVISVDESKSGKSPDSSTIRPLEVFSSLISQIIILRREQAERQKLEGQLQQAVKMESIGTLSGGIAHDFNNILAVILGNAELGLDDVEKESQLFNVFHEIKTAGARGADIVRQLLSFSRKTDQNPVPMEITTVIEDTCRLLRSSIPSSVEIETRYMDKATVMAHDSTIRQMIMNICINAYQSMPDEKGRIQISAEKVEIDGTRSDLESGSYARIIISDNGIGVSSSIVNRIFDPYFTTKDVGEGSGMGLAVVMGIVKNLNGAIEVNSKAGMGSSFSIFLPAVEAVPVEPLPVTQTEPGNMERILLVDDDPSIITTFEAIFKRLGYVVNSFTDPRKALELFRSDPHAFDLVLTDMTMPEMTGADLAGEVIALRDDIPIVICTGHSTLMDEEKAKALGISAYIMKPFAVREVASTIRNVLDNRKIA